jgi:hypothetical protein
MKARTIYTITLLLSMLFAADLHAGKTVTAEMAERWEYEIMSTLIAEYYGGDFELLLIDDHTEAWCIREGLARLRDAWPQLKPDAIDSLIARNRRPAKLARKLSIETEYRLMPQNDYRAVLSAGAAPDWDHFEEMYPETPGFMTISRVGFDAKYSQALVYFGNAYRCREERSIPKDRSIAFFVRKDDGWVLKGIAKGFRSFTR